MDPGLDCDCLERLEVNGLEFGVLEGGPLEGIGVGFLLSVELAAVVLGLAPEANS